jgi:hypothetical protein
MELDITNYGYKPKIHKMESVPAEWMGMPSDDIDPSLKKGEYCLRWAQFIYSMFYNNQAYSTWDKMREYRLNRLYGAGDQPKEFYMDWLDPKDSKSGQRIGLYNVSWDIWSPVPKIRRVVQGRFETQDHTIQANAIDKNSGVEKENMKWDAWADAVYGKEVEMMKALLGVKKSEAIKYVPDSLEELEMYAEMGGFKMKKEVDIEKALAYTEHISNDKFLKRKLIGDFFDINIAAAQDYFDPIDKKIKYKYLDPEMSIFDYSNEEDFSDMRWWGTQRLYSIKRVRMESGIPEEQLRSLALQFASTYGNRPADYINNYSVSNYRNKDGVFVYDQFKVPIFYSEWESIDKKYKTTRETKMGKVTFDSEFGKVWDTDRRKTEIKEKQNVYCCSWILGSKFVFGDGPLDLIPRNEKKQVKMTAHVYALPGKSIVASIKDNVDQLQLTKLTMQNSIANASPDGFKIEFGSLNNINLGDGDKTPLQLMKIQRMTGTFVYKATLHNGKYNTYASPIEKLEGGMGKVFEDCIRSFEINFNQISEITGIDRFSAASQKPGETTATEIKNVTAATTDSLQPLWAGYLNIKEEMSRNAAYRIQTIIKYIPEAYDVYYPVLGKVTLENLKLSKDITAASYGIKIEAMSTQEEKQMVMNAATEALKPGKDGENISFPEYLLIWQMVKQGQVKHAIAILTFRLNKRKKEQMKLQEDNMKLNAQNAQQQEMIKGQNEQAAIRLKYEEERKTKILEAFITKDVNDDTHLKAMQQKIIDAYLQQPQQPQQQTA